LRFFEIYATSIGVHGDPYEKNNAIWEQWEDYIIKYRENAPESLKSVDHEGKENWAWLTSQKMFIRSAFQGMAVAGIFAFLVLIYATTNIIQALISIFCVAIVILSVLALLQMKGWEIGVSESIAMVMIIGFAVDYVVHLSSDYMHSAHRSRN